MSPADDEVAVQAEVSCARYQLSRRGIAVAALVGGAVLGLTGGAAAVSAGQRRRLLLARILLCPAPVVLLDEPTEHLDPADAHRVLAVLLSSRNGLIAASRTVVVATHQLDDDITCPRLSVSNDG